MFGFGGLPQHGSGDAQFDRAQQVNELLVAQPLCRAINPDRSLLELGVRLTDGTLTSLRMSLPPGFPGSRPALSITSPVRHPWVDSIGRLSFPLLDRWGSAGVRLAAVVADALKGLGGAPAPLPSRAQAGAQAPAGQGAGAPPPPQQHLGGGGSDAARAAALPPIPAAFPEVEALSDEQLAAALADGAAYKRLVDAAAARLALSAGVERLRAETRELAAANLAAGEGQGDVRNQMAIIRSSEYAPAKAAFDAQWARQQAVLSKLSPDVLLRRLQEGAKAAEEEGERLVQRLGAGEVGVDAFVGQYVRAQATFHQRDLKLQAAQQTLPQLGV